MKTVNVVAATAQVAVQADILDKANFVRAVFSGPPKDATTGWKKVVVRPVELKAGYRWQVSWFDAKKDVTKNYDAPEIGAVLGQIAALSFQNWVIETASVVQTWIGTKSGTYLRSQKERTAAPVPSTRHDRKKSTVLDPEAPAPFLGALGFLSHDGSVKPTKQDKFTQINEFLRILDETGTFPARDQNFSVVDFGCGNAYLTFALYHRLVNDLGVRAHVVGVDLKEDLILAHREKVAALGWTGLDFEAGSIQEYSAENPPDGIVALHACDTATDDAIAQGLAWGSSLIVVAPCCHHNLQVQLGQTSPPAAFGPVFRYGLTSERLGDILTDAFRALILRIKGYRTDVLQFVDASHTPKNLMIRAVKTSTPAPASFLQEYRAMKAYWGVTPYLETKVGPLE